MKATSDLLLDGCIGDEISRELLGRKLVEGHVRIERLDNPFSPQPHIPKRVVVVTTRVPITCEI